MASVRQISAITKKQEQLREHLWPGSEPWLWNRKAFKGFTTIPKTMPLVLNIMDEMTKGTPVGSTYLSLWCATWDNSLVVLAKPAELAYASGFSGQRGVHTWTTRMKLLQKLSFIDIKAGKSGPMSSALIYNPHFVIREHYENDTPGLSEGSFASIVESALDLGAKDMLDEVPIPASRTTAPSRKKPAKPAGKASSKA